MAFLNSALRQDEMPEQDGGDTRFDERLAALSLSGKRPVAERPSLFLRVRTRSQHPED